MHEITAVEIRFDEYLKNLALRGVAVLPGSAALAQALDCDEATAQQVLGFAVGKQQVREQEGRYLILSPAPVDERDAFSLTYSARRMEREQTLLTQPIPNETGKRPALTEVEQRARRALGLGESSELVVIVRRRQFSKNPERRALQRVYLDPGRFPPAHGEEPPFWEREDFATRSLVHTYQEDYGYELLFRDTKLEVHHPTRDIRELLDCTLSDPILIAEQKLYAREKDPAKEGSPFVLEYLHGFYLNWPYYIFNRPPTPRPLSEW